ncbi:hypothetical protein E0Z10_g1076 [Xylaria hypoxylon]|uniref:Uncharacterized protein n=1 Tax=Xylaria hypoxylon TaxID=37992 RepID=A0A4Z0Z649_9PEZI|nr:hypothetical protein E0Z10_g1076 [Xylaria hypoxylon]
MGYPAEGNSLEDKVTSTVHTIIEIAVELGSSLAVLEKNTREIFWWTSWAIAIVLGLFVLHLLVKVRAQLVKLNSYQELFERMWLEDKENDENIQNERREREIQEARRATAPREAMEASASAQAQSQFDYLNDMLDEIGSIPEQGTEEYEELLEELKEECKQYGEGSLLPAVKM